MEGTGEGCGFFCSPKSPYLSTTIVAFLKTILAALFRTFGLLLRFLPSKASFLQDHLIIQHSDFPSFLAVSSTDKPINRSIHAHALT